MADSPNALPPEWAEALQNVASRRSKLHYKPAALLVALEILDEGDDATGTVPYPAYNSRFQDIITNVDSGGADKGWEPFYYLSTGDQVWDLYRNGHAADLHGRPSRANIESEIDEARIRPHLLPFLSTQVGRQAVREVIYEMLASDNGTESARLVEVSKARAKPDDELTEIAQKLEENGAFDPRDSRDARERTKADIVRRRGQREFRGALLKAYAGRCAITGCETDAALEAAHIRSYLGPQTNHVTNGILLRADIHTLFDLHLLSVDPDTLTVWLATSLRTGHYAALHGRTVTFPARTQSQPSLTVLREHFDESVVAD